MSALAAIALVALAVTGGNRTPAARAAPPSPDFTATLISEINAFRAQQGLPPLVSSPALSLLAQQHSEDMIARGYFDHTSPDGVTFEQRIGGVLIHEGYVRWVAHENLGEGGGRADPADILDAWEHSTQHRANLLATDSPFIGVGGAYADAAPGVYDGDGPVTVVTEIQGPPQPVLGQSVLGSVVSGIVKIRLPATKTFVRLTAPRVLPVGSELDTTAGRVAVTSVADEQGTLQESDFYQGRFLVDYVNEPVTPTPRFAAGPTDTQPPPTTTTTQQPPPPPATLWITEARLSGPLPVCTAKRAVRKLAAEPRAKPKPKRKPKAKRTTAGVGERHLWGSGKGNFRTRGKYASATVRGTIWLVRDDCTGTLVRVVRGVVSVQDFPHNRTVSVSAGQSYLARRPR